MNKKAESFLKYLEEKEIKAFMVEEIPGEEQHTVVFRSHVMIEGQQLPLMVMLDDSVFAMLRVLVSPKAQTVENEVELHKLVNEENMKYKPFKLYVDKEGNLVLDSCIMTEQEEVSGDRIYGMFDIIIHYLNDSYRKIMKTIW